MSQDATPSPDKRADERQESEKRSFVQRLIAFSTADILRIILLCLVVGLVLAAFNVDPAELWVDFFGTLAESIASVVETVLGSADRAIEYFLLGAVIVIPVWLFMRVLSAIKRD